MRATRPLERVIHPRSLRTRLALAIAVALVLSGIGIIWAFQSTVESTTRSDVERALHDQATAIAQTIERRDPVRAAASARLASRFIGDLRMVVSVSGEVVYFSGRAVDADARAEGSSGPVDVLLERPDAQARAVGPLRFLLFVALSLVLVTMIIWYLSGTLARRLRAAIGAVADSAEAVTQGHFDTRVDPGADELDRLREAFNRMTEHLETADRRQREFLADIAHELRTPVTTVDGFARALVDGTARREEDRIEAAGLIASEARRIHDLVDDLSTLTWLDLDPPVAAEPVDISAVAREASARALHSAQARGVVIDAPDLAAWAVGDRAHIDTILSNLLANALAACSSGGRVSLEPVRAQHRAGIAVTDTGHGIPEHLPHVFERLYRADESRSRQEGGGAGSGLGLAIVRRLAGLQGGEVTVRSAQGAGSTFTLWLPAVQS